MFKGAIVSEQHFRHPGNARSLFRHRAAVFARHQQGHLATQLPGGADRVSGYRVELVIVMFDKE